MDNALPGLCCYPMISESRLVSGCDIVKVRKNRPALKRLFIWTPFCHPGGVEGIRQMGEVRSGDQT